MQTLQLNGVTYFLPKDESDVIDLVKQAHAANERISLRGSAHSTPLIPSLEKSGPKCRYVMLSQMNHVLSFDTKKGIVKAQAGIHLGLDPYDPSGLSTLENSLLYQMDQQGWAVPDLGGITHQSLAGFISTGSSGGSTQYDFHDAILAIDMICCTDKGVEKKTFARPVPDNPDDPFYGALVSMGCFGIIVAVTLQGVPRFNISGQEAVTMVKDCAIDLFGKGTKKKPSFQKFLQQTEYTRLIWWPQPNVNKMVVWQAKRVKYSAKFKPKPYQEVPWIAGSALPASLGADILFTSIGTFPSWLEKVMSKDSPEFKGMVQYAKAKFYSEILPIICQYFVPLDDPKKGPQKFRDYGWTGLPMDNQMNDRLMPVWFTELWIPINRTQEVMKALQKFYAKGPKYTGSFCCEIYAARKSPAWLSPSYGTDVIRIDVFWFAGNEGSPADAFYPLFWKELARFNFRPHWGKFLPPATGPQGARYLKKQYPKWKNWMTLRQSLDPNGVFLNDYWRTHLGISK
jgi:D-arabinono-1,4-lactone oxidase